MRALSSQLFGVTASDPVTFAAVVLLLALVAVAASLVPAGRAASTDPTRALHTN
jgi:ABC-type lipoprotein release transport system permease subunit